MSDILASFRAEELHINHVNDICLAAIFMKLSMKDRLKTNAGNWFLIFNVFEIQML